MLDAVLLDDEMPALDLLRKMLEDTGRYLISGVFQHVQDAETFLLAHSPDVIFLDVEMCGINGLQFADLVRRNFPGTEIVFITAHSNHALEAYRLDALGYLLKPLHEREIGRITERLEKVCGKAHADKEEYPDIRLFGRMEVLGAADGKPIRWRTAKTEELFSFLYLQQKSFIHKEQILEALWPENESDRSQQLLYTTMYLLKKSMRSSGIRMEMICANSCYRMIIHDRTSDLHLFDGICQPESPSNTLDLDRTGRILKLYRGDLLDQHGYLWSDSIQRVYQERYAEVSSRLADLHADNGESDQFEAIMKQAIERLPWQETLHRKLLAHYMRMGKRVAFLAHYKEMEKNMREELGIVPDAEMRRMRLQME